MFSPLRCSEAIQFDGVRSQGYAFQVELTYRAVEAGFGVVEVPIIFRDREHGQSKMSWRIAAEAMFLVPRLRFGRQPDLCRRRVSAKSHRVSRVSSNSVTRTRPSPIARRVPEARISPTRPRPKIA